VKLLLKHGANLFLQSRRGYDAVHQAVMNNDTEIVGLLLVQEGADVNHQDEDGKTALRCAASSNIRGATWDLEPAIWLLASKGDNISIKDNYGSTPLVFVKYATEGIRKLLERHLAPTSHNGDHRETGRQSTVVPVQRVR